jgi:diguanylate cyclase (GGDEF)-like protein
VSTSVRTYLAAQLLAATAVVAFAAPVAVRSWGEVQLLVIAGVLVSGVVVTRFPLVHGSGRARQVYVVDGALFPMAVLLLPPAWALLVLSLPALSELASDVRPPDRRLLFPAATTLGHALAIGLWLLAAGPEVALWQQLTAAFVAAQLSMMLYNASVLPLLRWSGRGLPVAHWTGFVAPMPLLYSLSILPGLIIGVIGQAGPVPFVFAMLCGGAYYLLHWQNRRWANAHDRMDALFTFTAEAHTRHDAAEVEELALAVADSVLDAHTVSFEDAHAPQDADTISTPLPVPGRPRWLVARRDPASLRSASRREDEHLIGAIAQVTASALERILLADQLRREARRDALTGVMNRTAFEETVRELTDPRRDGGPAPFALAYGDLDGFKPVNDQHGHGVGDEVLRIVAQRLRGGIRDRDEVARVGGDEFLLLLHGVRSSDEVAATLAHVRDAVARPIGVGGVEVRVGISFGTARYPADAQEVRDLLRIADERMYAAKRDARALGAPPRR